MSSIRLDWAARPFGIFRDPQLRLRGRWILYSAVVGIVSGVGAIAFDLAFRLCQRFLLGDLGGFRPPGSGSEAGVAFGPEHVWLLPLSLVIGGLLSGALVFGLAPEAEGHGTDAVLKAFHHLRGKIRRRVPPIKAVASAITIGSGGSAGREGPIAQIGAGFGSFLADVLKLRDQDRRILMMAGVAGGIGSIFHAPLGAAFFAAEILYSEPEFEYTALMPGLIASITGYSIYSSYSGWGFLFQVPKLVFSDVSQLVTYVVLGVLCAIVGVIWPITFYGIRDRLFHPMPIPMWLKPAVGGLMLGGIAMLVPEALGMGYGYMQQAIDGKFTIGFLLLFAAVKILATSLTISSGGSGGVFGPSLVIGGSLGAAFGQFAATHWPGIAPDPVACIMVGMGGFFAGVAKVPFASVIMVMELTGSYGLLVPSLVVATLAYLGTPNRIRLYENQVPSRIDSPAHLGSFAVDVLHRIRVDQAWQRSEDGIRTIPPETPMTDLVGLVREARQTVYPVVDENGRLQGEVSLDDIRRALLTDAPSELLVAYDLMRPAMGPLVPGDDLARAAQLLAERRSDSIVIVKSHEDPEVLGLLTRRELIVAYDRSAVR
jgi:CIC family chloride channel protein